MKRFLLYLAMSVYTLVVTAQAPTSGLVAYWPLNGNFTDAGPNNISVTNTGATAAANNVGVANNAIYINNTSLSSGNPASVFASGAINAAINFNSTASYTISFAFRINATGPVTTGNQSSGFFDNNMNYNGYGLWFWRTTAAGNPIILHFNNRNGNRQTNPTTTPISLNTWYHMLVTVSSGTFSAMYINGNAVTPVTTAGTGVPSYTYGTRFGCLYFDGFTSNSTYAPFQGNMDELRIYNRVLSATEIAEVVSSALPLKLTHFNASLNSNITTLNWQTAQEQNTSHFDIERSTDGLHFIKVNTIQAAGNSNVLKNYTCTDYIDNNTTLKKMYYRLKMVDLDGAATQSNIVLIQLKQKEISVNISPNPAQNILQIQTNQIGAGLTTFNIIDAAGHIVQQHQEKIVAGTQITTIQVVALPPGNYILKITNDKTDISKAFIKL
jgi:hypothetical protein